MSKTMTQDAIEHDKSRKGSGLALPPSMTPAIEQVLSMMIWDTGLLARIFRAGGAEIPRKAEAEQAFVLWWALQHAIVHGDNWRATSWDDIEAAKARANAPAAAGQDNNLGAAQLVGGNSKP